MWFWWSSEYHLVIAFLLWVCYEWDSWESGHKVQGSTCTFYRRSYLSFSSNNFLNVSWHSQCLKEVPQVLLEMGLHRVCDENVTIFEKVLVAVCLGLSEVGTCLQIWQTTHCLTLWSCLTFCCSKPRQKLLRLILMKATQLNKSKPSWARWLMLTIVCTLQANGIQQKDKLTFQCCLLKL